MRRWFHRCDGSRIRGNVPSLRKGAGKEERERRILVSGTQRRAGRDIHDHNHGSLPGCGTPIGSVVVGVDSASVVDEVVLDDEVEVLVEGEVDVDVDVDVDVEEPLVVLASTSGAAMQNLQTKALDAQHLESFQPSSGLRDLCPMAKQFSSFLKLLGSPFMKLV
jgi:hypothetical protein